METIIIFIVLSAINVIASTFRSIITINGNKYSASFISAAYFAFYNIVMIYTVAAFPLWAKCAITFGCNLVGVFIVKAIEEKRTPVKMWKIEMALQTDVPSVVRQYFDNNGIPCNYNVLGKWTMFNFYCDTKEQSSFVKQYALDHNGKISAYESKPL